MIIKKRLEKKSSIEVNQMGLNAAANKRFVFSHPVHQKEIGNHLQSVLLSDKEKLGSKN